MQVTAIRLCSCLKRLEIRHRSAAWIQLHYGIPCGTQSRARGWLPEGSLTTPTSVVPRSLTTPTSPPRTCTSRTTKGTRGSCAPGSSLCRCVRATLRLLPRSKSWKRHTRHYSIRTQGHQVSGLPQSPNLGRQAVSVRVLLLVWVQARGLRPFSRSRSIQPGMKVQRRRTLA
jgi:hypothetical protein